MTTAAPAYLRTFAGVSIPDTRGAFQWPTPARNTITPVIGGVFDAAGTSQAHIQLPYQLVYTGAAYHATDTSEIATQLDALRALSGSMNKLVIFPARVEEEERWCWARLVNVSPDMSVTARGVVMFTLTFQILSIWYGDPHGGLTTASTFPVQYANGLYADPGSTQTLASSPASISVTNNGNLALRDAGIVVTAGSADITYLKLTITSLCELEYTGTIYASDSLILDCGARTVTNAGVDAFKNLFRTANHASDSWLTFDTGTTTLTVTFTGGSTDSTIIVTYSDGWA